jgi:uncharacterized protein
MSMSLRDQLLQAGLANERQCKEAERQLRQQQRERQQLPKDKRAMASHAELAAKQAQLAKAAHAQIEQLIEQNRLPRAQTDERYNFVDGNKVRRIPADHLVRERLRRGEIAIVRRNGGYELVPAETAARIRERDERAVIGSGVAPDVVTTDGVPEDLMW